MPRRVVKVRPVTESMIENKSVEEHEGRGWKVWKQSGLGRAGRPDRHYMGPLGVNCQIEFKKPGEFPTKLQQQELDTLEIMGHHVAACDSVDSAARFTNSVAELAMMAGRRVGSKHWCTLPWRERWLREHKKKRP